MYFITTVSLTLSYNILNYISIYNYKNYREYYLECFTIFSSYYYVYTYKRN